MGTYLVVGLGQMYAPEWDATLAAMRAFEEHGKQTRLVFWFDN